MPNSGQNSGGQQKHDESHEQKHNPKKTNIWNKIEGAVTKDGIGNLKQELGKVQDGQQVPGLHKKRRRRRRKKKPGENSNQNLNQKQEHLPNKQPIVDVKKVEASPFQYDSPDENSFEDDDAQEEKEDEPIFEDEDREVPAVSEVAEVSAVSPVPEVYETPEVTEVPEAPEATIEPEDTPPVPRVAPINPFDLPPNTSVVKPINPFDLADPASSVEEKEEETDWGRDDETSSPHDRGESNEFMAVGNDDSEETTVVEEDIKEDVEEKPEVIEVKAVHVNERKIEPVFPENVESKDDLWLILEHAGITKKRLIVFGVILLLILGGGLSFIFLAGGDDQEPGQRNVVNRPVVTQDKVQTKPVSVDQRPYEVISSYIFGVEYQRQNGQIQARPINAIGSIGGVDAGLIFGKVFNLRQERFVEYVQILEKMNNIYNVDIYSLLDLSVDRRATLDKYLKDMSDLIDRGSTVLANIQGDLQEFNTQYDATSKQANSYEVAFFNQVRNYYGQTSYDNLQLFMDTTNQAVKIKAQYGAENILKNMFVNSLAALKPKHKDILANTEALIKGVKVFDIKGSNINAIIPVQ